MNTTIESKEAFTVVGMKYRGKNEQNEIPALWGQFMPRMNEIKHLSQSGDSFGVMDHYDEGSGEFDYVAALPVDRIEDVPEGMVSWEVPANNYAVITFKFAELRQAFGEIYGWIEKSGHQRAQGPEFEYYPPGFDPNDPGSTMSIYIPIE